MNNMPELLSPNYLGRLQNSLLALAKKEDAIFSGKPILHVPKLSDPASQKIGSQRTSAFQTPLHSRSITTLYTLNIVELCNTIRNSISTNFPENVTTKADLRQHSWNEEPNKVAPTHGRRTTLELSQKDKADLSSVLFSKNINSKKF